MILITITYYLQILIKGDMSMKIKIITALLVLVVLGAAISSYWYWKELQKPKDYHEVIFSTDKVVRVDNSVNVEELRNTLDVKPHYYVMNEENINAITEFLSSNSQVVMYYKSFYSTNSNESSEEILVLAPYFTGANLKTAIDEHQLNSIQELNAFLKTTEYSDKTSEDYTAMNLFDNSKGNCYAYALLVDYWLSYKMPDVEKEFVVELQTATTKGHIYNRILKGEESYIVDYTKGLVLGR